MVLGLVQCFSVLEDCGQAILYIIMRIMRLMLEVTVGLKAGLTVGLIVGQMGLNLAECGLGTKFDEYSWTNYDNNWYFNTDEGART